MLINLGNQALVGKKHKYFWLSLAQLKDLSTYSDKVESRTWASDLSSGSIWPSVLVNFTYQLGWAIVPRDLVKHDSRYFCESIF